MKRVFTFVLLVLCFSLLTSTFGACGSGADGGETKSVEPHFLVGVWMKDEGPAHCQFFYNYQTESHFNYISFGGIVGHGYGLIMAFLI